MSWLWKLFIAVLLLGALVGVLFLLGECCGNCGNCFDDCWKTVTCDNCCGAC